MLDEVLHSVEDCGAILQKARSPVCDIVGGLFDLAVRDGLNHSEMTEQHNRRDSRQRACHQSHDGVQQRASNSQPHRILRLASAAAVL